MQYRLRGILQWATVALLVQAASASRAGRPPIGTPAPSFGITQRAPAVPNPWTALDGSMAAQCLGHLGFLPSAALGFQVLVGIDEPHATSLWAAASRHFCTADEDPHTVVHPQRNPGEA